MSDTPDLSPEDREWIDARADELFRECERVRGGIRPATVTPQDYRDYFVATAAWERAAARISSLEAELDAARAEATDLSQRLAKQSARATHAEQIVEREVAYARAEGYRQGVEDAARTIEAMDPDNPGYYTCNRDEFPTAIRALTSPPAASSPPPA